MILLVISAVVLLYFAWTLFCKREKLQNGSKSLPCENGIPVFGVFPFIKGSLYSYFWNLSKRHGPIFKCKFGMRDMVVISNFDVLSKAMKTNGDALAGRQCSQMRNILSHKAGIVGVDGHVWAIQRSFTLKVLRDFGLGKSKSNEIVQVECEYLMKELKDLQRKPIDFSEIIPIYTANIISKFLMNKRFERDDPNVQMIQRHIHKVVSHRDLLQLFLLMFPWADNSWILCKLMYMFIAKFHIHSTIDHYFNEEISNHLKELDVHGAGNDLLDRFLMEREETIKTLGNEETFTRWQAIRMSFELFAAGYETTSTTLVWTMMFLSKFPEIQEEMFKEISNAIGTERMAVMNDKINLPLTQAFMDEVFRLSSVTPFAIIHRAMEDTVVDGYFIAKDTLVSPNLFACHRDSNVWKKPFEFYPKHFLDESESGKMIYRHRKELVPFGLGKRQCLGESLARMEIFIFLVSIVQKYRVKFGDQITESMYENAVLGNDAIIRCSSLKMYCFDPR